MLPLNTNIPWSLESNFKKNKLTRSRDIFPDRETVKLNFPQNSQIICKSADTNSAHLSPLAFCKEQKELTISLSPRLATPPKAKAQSSQQKSWMIVLHFWMSTVLLILLITSFFVWFFSTKFGVPWKQRTPGSPSGWDSAQKWPFDFHCSPVKHKATHSDIVIQSEQIW